MRALKPTLDYAATRNVVVNLENDNPVSASAARTISAIELAHTRRICGASRIRQWAYGLGDERFNAQAVKDMFAHAWNIAHVKDAEDVHGERKTVGR